ncbi:MAG TPA: HEAT repeat domain-containing protein [Phycisphaerae bacterium]|nr:HEAT repeat domain-containing protein [Phycisphaerae bacterium]
MRNAMRGWITAATLAGAALAGACAGPQAGGTSPPPGPAERAVLEKAIGVLQEQFTSNDPAARANCVEAIQPLNDPRSTAMIEAALHDPEWVVRFAGAMAAGRRKLQELQPELEQMTQDANGSVRVGAVFALRRLGEPAARHQQVVDAALSDRDPATRANAALVLGLLGDRSAIGLLQSRALETDQRVRLEITAALARLGDADAQRVIVAQAMSKYGEDEWMAMDVCGDLPEQASAKPLLMGLEDAPAGTPAQDVPLTVIRQLVAARSLARQGSIQGADIAVRHLADPEPELRGLAALALGEILSPIGARQRLAPLLDDPDPSVRRSAAAAVVKVFARDQRNR